MSAERRDEVAAAAFRRLDRVLELGQALLDDIDHWRYNNPELLRFDITPDRHGCSVDVLGFEPELDLDALGLRLGEIAGHLRGLLNTMLTRIWELEGLPPSRQLQYPVTRSRKMWRQQLKVLNRLPDRLVRLLYAAQPFVRTRMHGRSPSADVLAVLTWLDNEAKHHVELRAEIAVELDRFRAEVVLDNSPAELHVLPDASTRVSHEDGHLVIDVAPEVITDLGAVDLWVMTEIMFVDEDGTFTTVRTLLWELLQTVKHTIVETIVVWADDSLDTNRFGGATDFRQGAAFGQAAVDGLHGDGTWLKDPYNRDQGAESRFNLALERALWDASILGPDARGDVDWKRSRFDGIPRLRLSSEIDVPYSTD